MTKSQAEHTTAENLEAKFERGEEVIDYFDVRKAKVVRPKSGIAASVVKKDSYALKRESREKTVVRERGDAYSKGSSVGARKTAGLRRQK